MRRSLATAAAALVLAVGLIAAEPAAAPDRPLASPAAEARAQALFDEVRCVVCQHESIADSPAGIAGDMRTLIRERIAAGEADREIRADLVRRYGDYILFRPPVRPGTWLLWFGPFAVVLATAVGLALRGRRAAAAVPPLSPDEERRLADLLQADRVGPDADAPAPHHRP